jgi:uncharacterized protein
MNIQPAPNEPALIINDHAAMIVADLHIGIERELRDAGLSVPSQTRQMEARLHTLITNHKIHDVYLLGDIKHNIPTWTIQERSDVKFFLERLSAKATVHILPGNHDGLIERLTPPNVTIHPSSGVTLGDIGLLHGHRWPGTDLYAQETLIIAHTHPTVQFTDRLGYKSIEPCWLRGPCLQDKLKEKDPQAGCQQLIVLPAFNPLCGGIAVNREALLGPVAGLLNIPETSVYLLDGTALGTIADLAESNNLI